MSNGIVKRNLSYYLLFGIVVFLLGVLTPLFNLAEVIKAEKNKKKLLQHIIDKDIIKDENSVHI